MLPTFSDMTMDGFQQRDSALCGENVGTTFPQHFPEQTPPPTDECELYIPAVHIAERGEQ